jgi:RNA polymerase sigma-70 factor (ECF subfamily)
LISTARFKAIDTLRRRARFDASQDELVRYLEAQWSSAERSNSTEEDSLEDDRLRLIFTCCHPSLAMEAHVALTLREVCGLTTEEIAKAFLITPRTLAQSIVRAKAKIRVTPIPYEVPTPQELPERLGADHPIQLMSQHPAVMYGRKFEIRPAADLNEMMRESERRRRKDTSR